MNSDKKPSIPRTPRQMRQQGAPSSDYIPSKEESRRKRNRLLIVIGVLIGVIVIIIGCALLPYVATGAHSRQTIRIPHGATGAQLRDTIEKYYDRKYADKVLIMMHVADTTHLTHTGSFTIEEGMSPFRAGRLLKVGAQTPVKITVNGFRSVDLLTDRIARKLETSRDSLEKAMTDSVLLAKAPGINVDRRLAIFIEDTYEVYWNTSPQELVEKFIKHYNSVWNKERTARAEALGLTPGDVMIICSIVDEESNAKSEKGTIGRLYINRLKKGMKLQADPTVRFALNDFTIRRVTRNHLTVDSPYNTYQVEGLPPGPIRTTSVETIDAVLNSQPNDYLYMCAKEDFSGTHNFAADYATHQENARRYQNALNERGIK